MITIVGRWAGDCSDMINSVLCLEIVTVCILTFLFSGEFSDWSVLC